MTDTEDEHYVKFGTPLDPLDEENLPRKKPVTIEDQYACDEQGRRRFHGAFTGGFSAGYFNTVGTRDGWRPQQFKSSRTSKAENKAQKPQDFMDDEDMGQFGIAPTAIRATSDYTDHENKGTKRERIKYTGDGPIPGTPVLRELLKPVKDTVGVKLLKQMGWKPGQGVGPRLSKKDKLKVKQQNDRVRVYSCPLPPDREEIMEADSAGSEDEDNSITFAPDDYEPFRCNPKDNFFGIGYSGLDKRPVLSQHVDLFEPAAFKLQEKNKKLSIRGQAFGVGAFEAEDEDIYSREDMSQYDFSLEPKIKQKSRWSDEKASTSKNKCITGFTPAGNHLETRKIFEPPELPKDFKPVHIIRKSRFEPKIESTSLENARRKGLARHDLRAEDRARIINDPNPITLVLSNESKSDPIKATDVIRIQKNSEENCLFPCVMDEGEIQPVPNSSGNKNDSNDNHTPKKPSIISTIISKTLNLHGREQSAINQEQSMNNSRANASKNSWLEKLNVKNFVKGGTETLSLKDGADTESQQEVEIEKSVPTDSESSFDQSNQIPGNESKESCKITDSKNQNSTFKPFIANPDKQKRYEQFLAFSKAGEKSQLGNIQPLSMTEWERDHERVEFEQAARLYKPLTGSMGDRFVSGRNQDDLNPLSILEKTKDADSQLREAAEKKMFGKLTRQRIEWQPASILCKRFNIAEPRTGCLKQETERKTKFSVFDYLEESVHNSSTFQSVTDVAVGMKSENSNHTSVQVHLRKGFPDPHRSTEMHVAGNSAMLMCDNAEKDKLSVKERNFEVKYERIFGKNVHVSETNTKSSGDNVLSRVENKINLTDTIIRMERNLDNIEMPMETNSRPNQGGHLPGPISADEETESGEILSSSINEKKDLFKAIFLSSSEDSDSDKEEELDDEKLKSLLIGKNPAELNVQRNTSPPRGIFANLDLDSLNDSSSKNNKINFIESKNSTLASSKSDETFKASGSNLSNSSSDVKIEENVKDSRNSAAIEAEVDLEILPDMYGPVLPSKPLKNAEDVPSESSSQTQTQKHLFKSVVVPVMSPASHTEGEWIEKRRKDKKPKKEKKKHKHKEHKKHKHKKHKR